MIRPIEKKDKEFFLQMVGRFYRSPAVLHPAPPQYAVNTFEAMMEDSPYAKGLIIEKEGAVAGYALLSLTWSNEVGGMVMLIEELFVEEEYRGQGLGKEFFAWLRREYAGKIRRFRLEATKENEGAIRLYERLGFQFLDYRQMVSDSGGVP